MRKRVLDIVALGIMCPVISLAYTTDDYVYDFEWQESGNTVEVAVGESYQLHYTCSPAGKNVFSDYYSGNWVYYKLTGGQRVISEPTGYSIDSNGVLTGLQTGKWAIKPTGMILRKNSYNDVLTINVVSEKEEKESNNSFETANEFSSKIKFYLSNTSDVDYFKYKHNMEFREGQYVNFKIHYNGSSGFPSGYKWSTFSGTQLVGSGSLISQDQICRAAVTTAPYVYIEIYFNSSYSQYFNYYDYFTIEVVKDAPEPQGHSVTGVTLIPTSLTLTEGDTRTLTATVEPANATNRNVKWTSSDTEVAVVDQSGKVTALSKGTSAVTVTTDDGGKTATCSVTVIAKSDPSPSSATYMVVHKSDGKSERYSVSEIDSVEFVTESSRYEYVDLGLSVKWATCNVGADKPEDYGGYYAWGETEEKDDYDWGTYKYCRGDYDELTKYCNYSGYGYNGYTDNRTVLEPEDDVAHVKWGGDWRMPTDAEWSELRNSSNCTWIWYGSGNTEFGGTAGYKVTSMKPGFRGNFIFLPAAGYRYSDSLNSVGSLGYSWSSSLYESDPRCAWSVSFNSGNYRRYYSSRYFGRSVRPVCP